MIPVLSVKNPVDAGHLLMTKFGFKQERDFWSLGDQTIKLVKQGETPDHFLSLPFDHLAIDVTSVDHITDEFKQNGGVLHPHYTPTGPREIDAFWTQGVRYVFFNGPDNAPIEFCMMKGQVRSGRFQHGHIGMRRKSVPQAMVEIANLNCQVLATHSLGDDDNRVEVVFLRWGNVILEIFDEPHPAPQDTPNWIGFVPLV